MSTWTLPLPWTRPPLSMNDRLHWRKKRPIVAEIRRVGALLARQQKVPACARVEVQLHYRPKDNRRRDASNLCATSKPLIDGLVDAGVVPDDCEPYLTEVMPRLHPAEPGQPGALWLTITDLTDEKEGTRA
ncbi:hypothetical protein DT076_16730 [Desertihabitans brevis]|uniref:Uncharacterized protein n=1 Tax=Desertihabitans brevis TaxID=2268447 RepID=A0A367YTD6_9ACTN|nr:hypothetical protein [Desertihabitans brevis]RCK68292.1 hypothetical protein DT076_16730 [Desertihabitans brevis]